MIKKQKERSCIIFKLNYLKTRKFSLLAHIFISKYSKTLLHQNLFRWIQSIKYMILIHFRIKFWVSAVCFLDVLHWLMPIAYKQMFKFYLRIVFISCICVTRPSEKFVEVFSICSFMLMLCTLLTNNSNSVVRFCKKRIINRISNTNKQTL